MIQVNALGDACPIPVVKTKNAIKELGGSGVVETLVDNEIAVQNLTKMANQKGYRVSSKKLSDRQYQVTMEIGENAADKQTVPTAAEQETVTGAAHREIHEITSTDIVPSEKECKTDFAVKNGCVNSIGSRVLKNQCPVTVILFQKRGVNL